MTTRTLRTPAWVLALLLATGACAPQSPAAAPSASTPLPEPSNEAHGLAENEHLMFRPQGNPESLLGREVSEAQPGKLVIADERRPGCVVHARKVEESWSREYTDSLERVVSAGLDLPMVAELDATYSQRAKMRVAVRNVERLDADVRGDCGERFVTSVRVGTGSRVVGSERELSGSAGVRVAGVGAATEGSQDENTQTRFSWDVPQAWSFRVGSVADSAAIELNAEMPTTVGDGSTYEIVVSPNKRVWLIVYYREGDGNLGVLLPSMEYPRVAIDAGQRRALPRLEAALRDPAQQASETIVLYAFDDEAYVKRFAPPRGEPTSEQMRQWESELERQLEDVSRRHWIREQVHYTIVPKQP